MADDELRPIPSIEGWVYSGKVSLLRLVLVHVSLSKCVAHVVFLKVQGRAVWPDSSSIAGIAGYVVPDAWKL